MANRIVLKKGTSAGSAPSASDLVPGELAINSADGAIFTKLENGTIYTITPANTTAISVSRGGTGLTTAPAAGQILYGQTGGTYALRTLTAGANITITEAAGSLTIASTASGGATVTVSETPPAGAENGDLWFDSSVGLLRVYYVGVSSSSWVDAAAGFQSGGSLLKDSLTTSTTSANQVATQIPASEYRSVKYTVQVTAGSSYQTSEVLIVHDGTTAYITEYAVITTGSSLATFNADVSSGNLRLLVTPANAVSTIRTVGHAVTV